MSRSRLASYFVLACLVFLSEISLGASHTYFVHPDHLGTPQVITDGNQNVVWKADYDPFGQSTVTVWTITNNLRFPGQYYDQETGLQYNYFRDYDPSTGRYIESDLIGLDGGINTYMFVGGNPIRYFDPDGLRARVRCRLIPIIGGVTRARHCYIELDPEDEELETYGLISDTGGPWSKFGHIYRNNSFDTGGTSCEWNDEPTVDQCVRDAVSDYANPSNYYFVRGPNSNTFAGTIARKCGLAKPKGFAPGWNKDPATQVEGTKYESPRDLGQ